MSGHFVSLSKMMVRPAKGHSRRRYSPGRRKSLVFPWRQGPLVPHSTQSSRIPGSAVSLQDPAIQPQQMDVASLMAHLAAGPDGLSAAEAHERLVKDGANVLPEAPRRAGALRLAAHLVNPFALLLWTGAGLAALGESFSPGEGMDLISAALIMVVVVNGAFSFWQETRVERAMAAFVGMLSHQARVVRGGEELQIPSADVVCGDVMILRKGDRVPADGRLITSVGLKVDNAILTGESEPQLRTIQPLQTSRLGARNLVFSGTLVTAGFGKAVVYATGRETEIGRIAVVTREISRVDTPIRNELRHFVRVITAIAVMLGCLFFTMGWALGNPFWTNLVFAIGIIVANVPEGLLPTVTLALALSGRRMAKRNALLKTLESAETMGSTTVICTDKTGTITQNRMTVTDLVFPSSEIEEDLGRKNVALRIMALCNNATVNRSGDRTPFFGDPTEVALLSFAESLDPGRVALMRETHPRLYERPFDSQTKEMATIHAADSSVSGDLLVVDLKGAPEVVLKQCGLVWASSGSTFMTQQVMNGALEATEAFARQGKRVLALATKELSATPSQSAIGDLEAAWDEMCVQGGYSFVGLVAMCDPPRPEVAGAVRRCHEAGIRVIVVSGDHPRTVEAVAREIGIAGDRPPAASEWLAESGAPKAGQPQVKEIQVVTGEQLRNMSQPALRKILQMENVLFARTSPLDKYRIVECLQSLNHVVAVTGDGVNDAPALKRADVGIAMGLTGTDVAREAADVVLFDDNFASIVAAVEEGRMIYGNIRRFIGYVLTSNVPEIIPYIAFVLADIPLPLPVLLILAIDLGTDLAPAIALANEPVEADVMLQPPRARTERLLSFSLLGTSYLVWGPIETLAGFAAYFFTLAQGGWTPGIRLSTQDPVYRQSIAAYFAAIVLCQIANVMSWRTSNESLFTKGLFTNKAVLMGIAVEMTLLFGIVSTDLGNEIFNTLPFAGSVWLVPAPFVCLVLLVPELLKWRKRVRLERRLALFGGSHA